MDGEADKGINPEPGNILVLALKKILRPLVRLFIANQITHPYMVNLLKAIYVEVAETEFPVNDKKQTDSRISLLTGVHRKDVKRLRNENLNRYQPPASVSIGAQLISRWLGDHDYLDASGRPLPLPLRTQDTPQKLTFDHLVEDIAKQDLRPRVVLDELLRLGLVEQDKNGQVILKSEAFIPQAGLEEKLYFFGKNIQDHICAASHNISGRTPPFFDRSVYYDKLSQESIDTLTEMCHRIGMRALLEINEKALELQTRDKSRHVDRYRMNFGIFNFSTDYDEKDDNDE
ncbi:MAG: DUF6502 family protein [Pseudomonadales bacterium]|nr:DUF6502 family protein [Pseudomonadales bacterium]